MKKWFFKTGILIVFMLAAGVARAALVTVSGSETWDGTANPHAADGVVLTTNGTTYTYAIPDGMTITGSGVINLGQNNVTFTFANGGLHLDSGRYIDADTKTLRYGARTFTLEMGTNNITGSGDIKGTYSSAIGVHSVTITGSGGVSLNSVDLRNVDAQNGSLSLHVGGAVSIGSIDVSAPSSSGGSSGSITVRAPAVTVSNVNAYAYSGTPGAIRLDALAYPYFGYQAWATNAHANTLTLNGVLRTKGTTGSGLSGGSAVLDGVNVVLGAGFNTNFNATGTFVLRCGLGGASHFTDNSGKGFAATQLVSHVEHPHAGARPQIIVFTNETWDGTANPHAADGVTLDIGTKTYALPTELYVTQSGAMNMGQPAATSDVKLSFTNGGFRMDSGANMTVNVGRYVYTKLTLDLGGYSILGAGTVAGGSATGSLGSRSLVVTNAGDVAFSAVQLLGYESANGSLQVTCTGLVEMTTVNTSDLSGGGDSAGNITVRGARVDVRDAYAYCARTDLSTLNAGNIMLEALKPPEFNPSQPINTRDNTLIVRGLLDTCGPRTQNLGHVTLRGAVVTLDTGFQLDLNSNGVFAVYAGTAEPYSSYFIENSTNGTFTATHNVQLAPESTPTIENLPPATNVVDISADVAGRLITNGSAAATVYLYWSTTDGGTNPVTWLAAGSVTNFGPYLAEARFTNTLSGLTPNTTYYWNHMASNSAGTAWATAGGSPSFRTFGPPSVNNGEGATNVSQTTATLRGNLTNGTPAYVFVALWADGAGATNWYDFGLPRGEGSFATNITGLTDETLYHYRCLASNTYGAVWAPVATNFSTPSGKPSVNNGPGATSVLHTSVMLNGVLTNLNGVTANVYVQMWQEGSGTTNWYDFGAPRSEGAFSTNVTGLDFGTLHHYRCYASNLFGTAWSPVTNFTTLTMALVTVTNAETWNGTANPHMTDGVLLSTNGSTYVYDIPLGMHITGSGSVRLAANDVTFNFLNGGLHMDSGGYILADTGSTRYPGAKTLTLNLGTNSITGPGDIKGSYPTVVGMHSVVITGSGGVSLNSVDLRNNESQNGSLSITVGGAVSVGSIDVSAPSSSGGNSGNITVRAPAVTVSNVNAYAYSGTPGAIRLDALAYPYFGYQAWATNSHANNLTLNGAIRTRGTTGAGLSGGSAVLNGVNVLLGAAFNTNFNDNGSFTMRCGLGGASHFTDNSGLGFTATQMVSHVEHPHTDALPQLIVCSNETWDGTANPRAADGVALDTGTKTYTLPKELYITQIGTVNMGDLANVTLAFTNGGLRLDSGANVGVTVARYANRTLTLELGGFDVTGAGTISGGQQAGPLGCRTVVVTNAGDVALDTVALLGYESQNGDLRLSASGEVAIVAVNTSDLSGGGDSAGNISIRGSRVDVGNAYAYCARSDLSTLNSGNILLEALMPPWFDWAQPVNRLVNTLTVRGIVDTMGTKVQNQGNVTLRGAVVTLDTGFQLDLNSNGVFQVYAGDGEPHSRYFVNNSSSGPFTATHNVQLYVVGTIFKFR